MEKITGYAKVNGTQLYYEITGAGRPLILMHGFGSDRRAWDDVVQRLAPYYRVLCFDMRGFGRSDLPTDTQSHYAEDLKALMDHLGIEHAFIGGQSLGGLVTIRFALTYPDAIDALVLVDAGLEGFEWSKEFAAAFEAIYATAKQEGLAAARALAARHTLGGPARERPELNERRKAIAADYSGWHWLNMTPYGHHDTSVARRLSQITRPALVLVGERDMPDFHRIADRLAQELPDARKVVLPGSGHSPHMETPAALCDAVLSFLQTCERTVKA